MIKLLQTAYPSHYGAKWKDVYSVRFEHTYLASFAIKDNKPTIIQDEENSAVSLYVNPEGKNITIVDWEAYVNQYTNALCAGEGKKCDFIVYDDRGDKFILDELTYSQEKHIIGIGSRIGKRIKARIQLSESINKLYSVPEIQAYISAFEKRIALFSYRIAESSDDEIMSTSMAAFSAPTRLLGNIEEETPSMPHDFVYHQHIYPNPFEL